MNFQKLIVETLKDNNKAFTAKELAELLAKKYPQEVKNKINRTRVNNEIEVIEQWRHEICAKGDSLEKYNIYRTSDRPKKYFYSDNSETGIEKVTKKNNQPEADLYPVLREYCKSLGINSLRINEKTSLKNKGLNYNIWLHPDIVGFKDLTIDYTKEVKECIVQCSGERSCLYAFEVKDEIIQTGNLRKFFFQTVSNSSWANYSYLVAMGVEDKAESELQLLCNSFNIGFIQLDKDTPKDSQIKIQAPKTDVDWNMINRIAKENPDFRKYVKNISLSHKSHTSEDIAKPYWA